MAHSSSMPLGSVNSANGKVIIVTGAGAGIGFAIANTLLGDEATSLVISIDVNTEKLKALIDLHSERLTVIQGDVSDRSVSQRAVETALNRRGKVDCLILNAGVLNPVGRVEATAVAEWKNLFDINFFALVHAIQLALPYLRRVNGQVLMTSSGVSLRPFPSWVPYACSKAAMNCLCSCLPTEEDQVRFLCVTPGIVDSGMQGQAREQHKSNMTPQQHEWLSSLHTKGELLRPQQPANSFAKLALRGIPKALNGMVISWNDPRIDDE